MRIGWLVAVFAAVLSMGAAAVRGESPDRKFYVFLCFGQSNSEGYPGLEEPDKVGVDERFRMLGAVDFPKMGGKRGSGMWRCRRCVGRVMGLGRGIILGGRW